MLDKPNSTSARDIAYTLHPYTNARLHEQVGPLVVETGKGVYVYDESGKEYLEAMAGLWSAGLGFNEERLVNAAIDQLKKLPFYHNFLHKTNTPTVDLAERLVNISPERLKRAFFANSGSEANDTVVKLVRYYNNALGRPEKKKIIARLRAYHGITVASGSLTGLPWNHHHFDLPMAGVLHTSTPFHYRNALPGETEEEFSTRLAAELEELILKEGPDTVAAFIGEPVMGAGGVLIPPSGYWQKIQEVCRRYDVLIIADEVICGFGRTGNMFGCETYDIDPDFLVLSKQITSSYQPLSAILFTDEIYQKVADNSASVGTFGHGFTTGGHPVATAVAVENLKIFEERNIVQQAAEMGGYFNDKLAGLRDHPMIGDVRGVGLLAGLDLVADKVTKEPFAGKAGQVGPYLMRRSQENGLIIRAIGDIIALCPPLIISRSEIDELVVRFTKSLDETYAWAKS